MQVRRHSALIAALALLAACSGPTRQPAEAPADPRGSFLVFADLRGTLKPCGCSPDLQRGGVDRVAHHVATVRHSTRGIPVFHAGNLLVDDEGVPEARRDQSRRRIQALAGSLKHIGLSAATLGAYDVALDTRFLRESLAAMPMPVVVSNAGDVPWADLVERDLIVEAGGLRIGLLGLLPASAEGATDPTAAAREGAARLRSQGADVVLVLSSMGLRYAKRMLRKDVDIDLLLAAGQDLEAVATEEVEPFHQSWLFQAFVQGGQVGRIDLDLTGDGPLVHTKEPAEGRTFRYALSGISWDLPRHPEVAAIMDGYDRDLKAINLKAAGELPPLQPGQASYVGVAACLECHEETRAFWEADRHQIAWETLERDGKTFDLECIGCHSTGYGKAGGAILGAMDGLVDVQCESCHGPGSLHAESGDAADIQRQVSESLCVTCHNPKHSTRFEYDHYRSRLIVPGHGK